MDEILIREVAEPGEDLIAELSRLLIDVVADGASIGFLPPLSRADAEAYWRSAMGPGVALWVAQRGARALGTVQLHLCLRQNGSHRAEIAKLMVHPEARRLGLARRMMAVAERRAAAEARSLLVLDTRAGDPSNLLYRSLGFVEAGRIPFYARSAGGRLDESVFYYKILEGTVTSGSSGPGAT